MLFYYLPYLNAFFSIIVPAKKPAKKPAKYSLKVNASNINAINSSSS